ncbi:MAG: hypothetical protein OEW35_17365 [Gammaproteobacteria bacterium]|nr:hypothetical protein [Gammaproteobacteria bacterium]
MCKRYLESGGVDDAIEQVATDRMVSYFFSVDFEMLSETEGDIVRYIAWQSEATSDAIRAELELAPDVLDGSLRRLENLGIVLGGEGRRYALPNYFFRHWLQSSVATCSGSASPTRSYPG